MDHPRSKLPAVLAILFCIALLGGVGVLLWKTLPEKQQPQQAETIQTDSVFSSEQTAVEPEREAPYEGELPEQAEAAQPEQPDSEQPSEPAADPAAPDDTPVTDAQKTAQATLASMTEDEKLWQLFFVTPEAITNVNTATVAGEATKNALAQYPVGGIVYFAKNLEDRAQAAALLANTQSYFWAWMRRAARSAASAQTRRWAARRSPTCAPSARAPIPRRSMPPGRRSRPI